MSRTEEMKFHLEKLQGICNELIGTAQIMPGKGTQREERVKRAIMRMDPARAFRRLAIFYAAYEPSEMEDGTQQAFFDVLFLLNEIIETEEK